MSDETQKLVVGIVVILIGVYCIAAAVFNWNWFFNNSRAKGTVRVFKRKGARIFYAFLGLVFAGTGIFLLVMT